MQPWALYNENDKYAADWLENLILAGQIAPGIVDRRSIEDLLFDDLRGFRQVHFFAGIGVWSYALRRAGVSDDVAVWTGSCPCQPFSAAGKGGGVDDERHLWPAWHHSIRQHRPPRILGEQVASKDGLGWLDAVSSDLEAEGYTFGAVDTCSASAGAPHIRQRLRFVAYDRRSPAGALGNSPGERSFPGSHSGIHRGEEGRGSWDGQSERSGPTGRLADDDRERQPSISQPGIHHAKHHPESRRGFSGMADCGSRGCETVEQHRSLVRTGAGESGRGNSSASASRSDSELIGMAYSSESGRESWGRNCGSSDGGRTTRLEPGRLRHADGMDDILGDGRGTRRGDNPEYDGLLSDATGTSCKLEDSVDGGIPLPLGGPDRRDGQRPIDKDGAHGARRPGPTNGFWRDADWLFCRDERWRPIEPGTFPLAHGAPARVGRLRAYGNAVDAEATTDFIEACIQASQPHAEVDQPRTLDLTAAEYQFEDLLG